MFSINLVAVFFRYFCAHLADGGEQVSGDAGKLVRIGGVDKNADRQIHGHLFEALFLPGLNGAEGFCGCILIIQFVDRAALPDYFNIAGTGLVALFGNHGSKLNLVNTGLQADTLSFLYICANFYDQLCVFS